MKKIVYDVSQYQKVARQAIAEGCVLLENQNSILPLKDFSKVALFGRTQFNYYKSGTGSGGMVNTSYVKGILEAIQNEKSIELNNFVLDTYKSWLQDNPFDTGIGWAAEPWFQAEMPISKEFAQKAKEESNVAIVIIGRTAGEDQDNKAASGSYLLTDNEHEMLDNVTSVFDNTIVLLNVGNIIDMKWVKQYNPQAVLYVWQGGQEGGMGVLDILTGRETPSGRLSDTIAFDIQDYPSTAHFGDEKQNLYTEDIYVGYRYFSTFAPEKVVYPFGFGLSYTSFKTELVHTDEDEESYQFQFTVTNQGEYVGKEVVQIYLEAPQGKLGKASRSLCGFAKTKRLQVGESEDITVNVSKYYISSFDDSGVTGNKNCFVLEAGDYHFYIGKSVEETTKVKTYNIPKLIVTKEATSACEPTENFRRMKPGTDNGRSKELTWETVGTGREAREKPFGDIPKAIEQTGDTGFKLVDVFNGKVDLEVFIAQLSDKDLIHIARGEGMSSEKVTAGTAGAFGGVTQSLLNFGIPIACCADGPSGIRMDCGTFAFAMPNGTSLACTFNEELSRLLFEYEALEMRKNKIDTLLGPGINIHRSPLNGRNFEYFSEDPFLTGKLAAAQIHSMHKYQVTGTIKHFACNNQEFRRHFAETVLSTRALREIYLRGFEIAIKEAGAYSLMSTYGPLNGFYTASNYELLTTILRDEWEFQGIVMTDWWARGNYAGEVGTLENAAANVKAQNDLMMVTRSAIENSNNDNLEEELASGRVTRGELQRNAKNICKVLMKFPSFLRSIGEISELERQLETLASNEDISLVETAPILVKGDTRLASNSLNTGRNSTTVYCLEVEQPANYKLVVSERAMIDNEMAQLPYSVFIDGKYIRTETLTGKNQELAKAEFELGNLDVGKHYLKFFFSLGGIHVEDLCVFPQRDFIY